MLTHGEKGQHWSKAIRMTEKFVDVWQANILSQEAAKQNYYELLNADEKQKVDTFLRAELQQKYINTRGILRKVLGTYLNMKPQDINIKTAEYGKPFVDDSEIFFNLSHTGNKLVIAVSNVSEIGIDLEQLRGRKNLKGLVKKCLSTVEKKSWESLSEQQQIFMFYYLWVRKEALVKAIGRGIAMGLDQCIVDPVQQTKFLSIPGGGDSINDWKIVEVKLNQEDVCALVIKDINFNYQLIELE